MTDDTHNDDARSEGTKGDWLDKLSETVTRATDAVTEAWDKTADARKEAWEKTKDAAASASSALDKGVDEAASSFHGTATAADGAEAEPNTAFDYGSGPREIRAPRGTTLNTKGWLQEAALRCLLNNLDPEVAEIPLDLVVYGGRGKAARNWDAFDAIVRSLTELESDETLLVQSGKPVGRFRTHEMAP